ncbi:MAG: transporter substrate-binding domain-containing protein [Lachnospiraceae bacterium]|nr:transporter substrate-binding domain-containing protein [Lachnospiraceae bacterium]
MNKRKKLSMILALCLALCLFAGCGQNVTKSDIAYIQGKGTLLVGVTNFAPMDYPKNGEWVGFDADLAKLVGEELGVTTEFVEINWEQKEELLKNKDIDVVWNGLTLTEEVAESMTCSLAYCNNAQVVVVPKEKAEEYRTEKDVASLLFAVEAGSAGEKIAIEKGFSMSPERTQSEALKKVVDGSCDAGIIDLLMAGAMVGEGTRHKSLAVAVQLTAEEYVVGCRKGSDLAAYLDEELTRLSEEGKMREIATLYGVQDALRY